MCRVYLQSRDDICQVVRRMESFPVFVTTFAQPRYVQIAPDVVEGPS